MITYLSLFADTAKGCANSSFLGFPTWYQFLSSTKSANGLCTPVVTSLSDIWLILAAVLEILLRIAALAAVGYVIYGGVKYTISQGSSDATAQARGTIIYALVGLFIAVTASVIVQFIASRFNAS